MITPRDGIADEFYYDGKTMMAYMPSEDLVAVTDALPTIVWFAPAYGQMGSTTVVPAP